MDVFLHSAPIVHRVADLVMGRVVGVNRYNVNSDVLVIFCYRSALGNRAVDIHIPNCATVN